MLSIVVDYSFMAHTDISAIDIRDGFVWTVRLVSPEIVGCIKSVITKLADFTGVTRIGGKYNNPSLALLGKIP